MPTTHHVHTPSSCSWPRGHRTPHTGPHLLPSLASNFTYSSPTLRPPRDTAMAALHSVVPSAPAIVAFRGFGGRRLSPCPAAAAPARRASGATSTTKRAGASASPAFTAEAPYVAVAEPLVEAEPEAELSKLACPICYYPLVSSIDQSAPSNSDSGLECSTCKKVYSNKDDYWDLTVAVGSTQYSESMPAATELFRTPLVSFLYERGWRQNFIWGGFPGLEREFEMAQTYLKPVTGGIIVDASCGSGLFSRLFVKSELYCLVVALDFSENMLKQCKEFTKQENISDERLALVRADISRLPFVSGSIDAVHAGAAIHCWPSPACAVAEISRVLRPGGILVASTFIVDVLPPVVPLFRIGRPYISQVSGSNIFLSELELEDLCRACGLVDFTFVRNGFYIMFSATKAS